jgi:very-short-patch-repair endonuclease
LVVFSFGMATRSSHTMKFLRQLDQLSALVESVGRPCWAAGITSAPLLGFDGFSLSPPFHLAVPHERAPHRFGHHVHRLRDVGPLDTTTAFDLPCLSATRTLIELAAIESPKRLTTALDSALRDGLTSEAFLHRRIVELRRPGRPGIARLLAVIEGQELSRGGHSFLEREFLELLGELDFPRPATQQVVGSRGTAMIRVDCRFRGCKVVVELLGYRFHRSTVQMQIDAERINRMQLDGFVVAQFTYADVTTRSTSMLSTLEELRPRILRASGRL